MGWKLVEIADSRFWGFCAVCKISLPTTFRKPLWVLSEMVIGWSVNERQSGMPLYVGVEWMWAESDFARCAS